MEFIFVFKQNGQKKYRYVIKMIFNKYNYDDINSNKNLRNKFADFYLNNK